MFVDSHCHLDRLDYDKVGPLAQVLDSARGRGVERCLSPKPIAGIAYACLEVSSSFPPYNLIFSSSRVVIGANDLVKY